MTQQDGDAFGQVRSVDAIRQLGEGTAVLAWGSRAVGTRINPLDPGPLSAEIARASARPPQSRTTAELLTAYRPGMGKALWARQLLRRRLPMTFTFKDGGETR